MDVGIGELQLLEDIAMLPGIPRVSPGFTAEGISVGCRFRPMSLIMVAAIGDLAR